MLSLGRKKEVRQDTITAGSWVVRRIRYGTPLDSHLVVITVFSGALIVAYVLTRFWPLLIPACYPLYPFYKDFRYYRDNDPEKLITERHKEKILELNLTLGSSTNERTMAQIDQMESVKNPVLIPPKSTKKDKKL